MSSVVISGDTSGSVTLQAPATAGTTVLTLPATSGTVITTASGTAATATTATNLAGGSNGTIPYQSAAGTTQMLAVGTSGQVLQTNGVGAPTWTTPAAGALVLLSTIIASGTATVDVETTFSSTYTNYVLEVAGLKFSANSGLKVRMKISGAYVTTGTYSYHTIYSGPTNTAVDSGQSAVTTLDIVPVGMGTAASTGLDLTIHIKNPASTTLAKQFYYTGVATDSTPDLVMVFGAARNTGTGALTGIRFYGGAGNIDSGTFRLYGIANS